MCGSRAQPTKRERAAAVGGLLWRWKRVACHHGASAHRHLRKNPACACMVGQPAGAAHAAWTALGFARACVVPTRVHLPWVPACRSRTTTNSKGNNHEQLNSTGGQVQIITATHAWGMKPLLHQSSGGAGAVGCSRQKAVPSAAVMTASGYDSAAMLGRRDSTRAKRPTCTHELRSSPGAS